GEMISVQCELAQVASADPRYAALAKREEKLLRDHKAGWTLGLPDLKFWRGFVELVRLHLEDAGRYRALIEREPIRTIVVVGGKRGSVRDLLPLSAPLLTRLATAPERQRAAD